METGTIKTYIAERGFGFIARSHDRDIFFHISGIQGDYEPEVGQRVTFETRQTDKGPIAYAVAVTAGERG